MKKLVTITNEELIKELKDKDDITRLYPLENYCLGYDLCFDIKKIDDFVLINRILNDEELDELEILLKGSNIKGIVFDDLGILEIIKDLKVTKILLLDHLALNSLSINYYLDYVDSVVVSSDLTYEEIKNITSKVKKDIVIYVYGLKRLMISRRRLLSNYIDYYGLDKTGKVNATVIDHDFIIKEDDFGTTVFMKQYYNGLKLLSLDHVLYFWYDLINVDIDQIKKIIYLNEDALKGSVKFLEEASTYKIRG